jgi:hypothetical protein
VVVPYGGEGVRGARGGPGRGGSDERGRRVVAGLQRGHAGVVRAGDPQRIGAVGGVLLQPACAAGLLLPVRAQPGVQRLHQQPQLAQGARVLRHRHPALLGAPLPAG